MRQKNFRVFMQDSKTTRIEFPLHYTDGIGDRTKSGNIIKNFEFYRSINRDNLWNDPYHASKRTWRAYHSVYHSKESNHSVDAVHKHKRESALRIKFVESSRRDTLSRFRARRVWNMRCATANAHIPMEGIAHRRQDVCSGLTDPIGGDIRDLPVKAIRRTITRTIAHLDSEATNRLETSLRHEDQLEAARLVEQAKRRAEILNECKDREMYWNTLESLSGIAPRPRAQTVPPKTSDRISQLARPKLRYYASTVENCLDGTNLVHVSTPEVFTMHENHV